MKEEEVKELVMELSSAVGISGKEDSAVAVASRHLERYATRLWRDRLGSLIAFKEGENPGEEPFSLALVAHIDEIGAMVTRIEEEGMLRFTAVGGIDPRILPGQPVVVHGRSSSRGCWAKAPHLLSEQERRRRPSWKISISTSA